MRFSLSAVDWSYVVIAIIILVAAALVPVSLRGDQFVPVNASVVREWPVFYCVEILENGSLSEPFVCPRNISGVGTL